MKTKMAILSVLYCALLMLHGFLSAFSKGGDSNFWLGTAVTVIATMFATTIAQSAGKPFPRNSIWLVAISWPVTIPGILIRAYKVRGFLLSLLFVVVSVVCLVSPVLLVHLLYNEPPSQQELSQLPQEM